MNPDAPVLDVKELQRLLSEMVATATALEAAKEAEPDFYWEDPFNDHPADQAAFNARWAVEKFVIENCESILSLIADRDRLTKALEQAAEVLRFHYSDDGLKANAPLVAEWKLERLSKLEGDSHAV